LNKNIEGKYKSGKNGMGQKQRIRRSIQRTGLEIGRGWRPSRGYGDLSSGQRMEMGRGGDRRRTRRSMQGPDKQRIRRGIQGMRLARGRGWGQEED
jgi:hypothetical protein